MMMKSRITSAVIALTAVFSFGVSGVHASENSVADSEDPSLSGPLAWKAIDKKTDVLPVPLARSHVNPNEPVVIPAIQVVNNEANLSVSPACQKSVEDQTSMYQTPLSLDYAKKVQDVASEKQKKLTVKKIVKKEQKKVATAHYAIATEPVNQSDDSTDVAAARVMYVSATAYSSTPDQTDGSPCTTANGYNVCKNNQENVLAANFLPFGTKVRMPDMYGDRVFVVQDRMARRFSDRIDVWMKTRDAAMQFGYRKVKIEVLED